MMPRPMPYGPATTAPIGPPATKTRRTPSWRAPPPHRRSPLNWTADNLIERTPENIGLLHDIVDTVHGMDPKATSDTTAPTRPKPPAKPSESISSMARSRRKTMYGGWNPDRDRYLRVNKDGRLGRHGPDHRGPAHRGTTVRRSWKASAHTRTTCRPTSLTASA